jgi:hypothetical protein
MVRQMRLEKILGDVASWWWIYLAAKCPHAGVVGVDGLVFSLHQPTTRCYQPRGQDLPTRCRLTHHCSKWRCLSGERELPGIDI